jgi:Mrp family chromosome partitioning ATPase
VDGVVLVINIKRTTRSQAAWSREMLTEINAPLLGAVVNGIDSTSAYGYEYASYGRSRYAYTAPATLPTSPTSTPPPPTPSAASASPPSKRKAKTKPTELADAVSSADPS